MPQMTQEEQLRRMVDSLSKEVANLNIRAAAAESLASMYKEENDELKQEQEQAKEVYVPEKVQDPNNGRVVQAN